MFKVFLCLVIILACGGLGMIKAQTYNQRLRELTDFKDMIQILKTEMSYRKDPLPAAFARISAYKDNPAMDLLFECSKLMKENLDFKQCWQQAMREAYRGSELKDEDRTIIEDLGLQLGKSDIQGQASMFALAESRLNAQIDDAIKEKGTKGRMYKGMGFSIGIVIAVILI